MTRGLFGCLLKFPFQTYWKSQSHTLYFKPSKRRRRRRTTPTYNVLNMISTLPTFAPTPQEKQQARYFGPQNNPQGKCIY